MTRSTRPDEHVGRYVNKVKYRTYECYECEQRWRYLV